MSLRLVVLAVALALPLAATATTLRVPSEYGTIRAATFVAVDGDTVIVSPGTYLDRFTIHDKSIVLRGETRAADTILDGSLALGNVITLHRVGRGMIVEDLTITGGAFNTVAPESVGTAVYVNQGAPTIQRCILTRNHATAGGGVYAAFFSTPLVRDCWIAYNDGGGIFIETHDGLASGPRAELRNTFIVRNTGFGISVTRGAKATIKNCTIAYNSGDGLRSELGAGGAGKCYIAMHRSLVTNHGGAGVIRRDTGVCFDLQCNDVWENLGGNYVGSSPGDPCFTGRGVGDVSIDPQYADPTMDRFELAPTSVLLTVFCGPGSCGAPGAGNSCTISVQQSSWGALKEKYR